MPSEEQSLCLIDNEGWRFMKWAFDNLSPEQREILRNSKFNICAQCFADFLFRFRDPKITLQHMEAAIETGDHGKLKHDASEAYNNWRSNFEQH